MQLSVNGKAHELNDADPDMPLLWGVTRPSGFGRRQVRLRCRPVRRLHCLVRWSARSLLPAAIGCH